jgi:predicted XRE-type DNA-binding protein
MEITAYDSVWEVVADTAEEAANLSARSDLMRAITAIIKANGWKQAEAAKHMGVTQPRVNELLKGHIDRFSLDALINIAAALGRKAKIELIAA